jgi:hypothetical protein
MHDSKQWVLAIVTGHMAAAIIQQKPIADLLDNKVWGSGIVFRNSHLAEIFSTRAVRL